jgi:hypothetical protein
MKVLQRNSTPTFVIVLKRELNLAVEIMFTPNFSSNCTLPLNKCNIHHVQSQRDICDFHEAGHPNTHRRHRNEMNDLREF